MINDIFINESAEDEIFLVLQNENGTKLGVPLRSSSMKVDVNNSMIDKIKAILDLWGEKRKEIAEYYVNEKRERDSFVYDLLALAHFTSQLKARHDHLLGSWNATDLLHDRVVAQLLYELSNVGYDVEPKVSNALGAKNHDFNASIFRCEVKSLRIQVDAPFTLRGVWLEDGAGNKIMGKLRQEFYSARRQAGQDGIVFFAPLSANLNALFRSYFKEAVLHYVPPLQAGTIVLVLPTQIPFKDCYLVFQANQFLIAIQQAVSDVQAFGIRDFTMFSRWPFQLTTAARAGSSASFLHRGN